MKLPILVLACATIARYTLALTEEELSHFVTTSRVEHNTDLTGSVSLVLDGEYYMFTSNGVPDHETGTFPGNSNPNQLQAQNHNFMIPANPQYADEVSCIPLGPIAFATNGIPLFNPFNANGENAVEGETAEVFDDCDGHPDQRGTYHYHQIPSCVPNSETNEIVGIALDGFPVYGPYDENMQPVLTEHLDECHGKEVNGHYRYHMSTDFPYIISCYKGVVSQDVQQRLDRGIQRGNCFVITAEHDSNYNPGADEDPVDTSDDPTDTNDDPTDNNEDPDNAAHTIKLSILGILSATMFLAM